MGLGVLDHVCCAAVRWTELASLGSLQREDPRATRIHGVVAFEMCVFGGEWVGVWFRYNLAACVTLCLDWGGWFKVP